MFDQWLAVPAFALGVALGSWLAPSGLKELLRSQTQQISKLRLDTERARYELSRSLAAVEHLRARIRSMQLQGPLLEEAIWIDHRVV